MQTIVFAIDVGRLNAAEFQQLHQAVADAALRCPLIYNVFDQPLREVMDVLDAKFYAPRRDSSTP